MRVTNVCTVLVLFVFVADFVNGAIYVDELKTLIEDNGKVVKYCEYKGIRLMKRSKLRDYDDCSLCRCNRHGLTCATMFGIVMVPEDSMCDYKIVACKIKWFLKSDMNVRCPKKWIPGQDY